MIAATTAEDLRRICEECERAETQLEKELADVRAERAAAQLLLARHPAADYEARPGTLAHAHVRLSALARCPTQMDAFKEIARRSGGIVRLTEASRLVHDAGLSQGKVSSIVSSMPRKFLERGEWEWVDSGIYRLLEYGDGPEDATDGTTKVDGADQLTADVA